jgi:AcrR family transcriptional regulator
LRGAPAGLAKQPPRHPITEAQRRFIAAAHALLSEQDLASVSVVDLCDKASLARGTFYFHFSSKYSLVELMLTETLDEIHAAIDSSLSLATGPTSGRLLDVLASGWDLWIDRVGLLNAVSTHAHEDPDLHRAWTETMENITGVLAERIGFERAIGVATPGPSCRALARSLVWTAERHAVLVHTYGASDPAYARAMYESLRFVWSRALYDASGS